jgi:hypothetical protein
MAPECQLPPRITLNLLFSGPLGIRAIFVGDAICPKTLLKTNKKERTNKIFKALFIFSSFF